MTTLLPPADRCWRAVVERDAAFDGLFVTAVSTTGIFCRPSCPARRPARENVGFFATPAEAVRSGYRACLRCRPLESAGETPDWVRLLLADLEADAERRWTDADLRERGLDPVRVRRWFLARHGTTFHGFARARRLGRALGRLRDGASVVGAAMDAGFESLSGFYEAFRRTTGHTPARGRDAVVLRVARIETPLGPMVAGATDDALCLLEFLDRRSLEAQVRRIASRLRAVALPGSNEVLRRAERELGEWFAGTRRAFGVPLCLVGTDFQRRAWEALLRIPHGETRSYAEQAALLGRPGAVRAVARANGANALAILVPCHRVVGSDGRLTGYGGGLWRKRRLLEIERGEADRPLPFEETQGSGSPIRHSIPAGS